MTNRTRLLASTALLLATCATAAAFGRGGGGAVAARGGYAAGGARGFEAGGYRGGVEAGGYRGSYEAGGYRGAYGGAAAGGFHDSTRVTPGGTTIQHEHAGGVSVGPYGGVHAGGESATKVTGPGGRSVTDVSGGRVNVGPGGGVRASGFDAAGARGYYGGAAVGARGVAVGHYTGYVSGGTLASRGYAVRAGFHYNCFTPGWWGGRVGAWYPGRWVVPSVWAVPAWGTLASFCGYVAAPANYDYGSTVVIQNDNVYIGGESAGTADQFATQAINLAETGRAAPTPDTDEWQPLGVFGMVQGDEKIANNIFQLAINKGGVIRGNYYDAVSDSNQAVYGSVDKTTQRAAWSIGDKKDIVFEAGIGNLTQDQCTLLVHYGKTRTEQMTLVRLEEPKGDAKK